MGGGAIDLGAVSYTHLKDEIRGNPRFQFLEERFYFAPVVGHEPIFEFLDQNLLASGLFEKRRRAAPGFLGPDSGRTEDNPVDCYILVLLEEAQDGTCLLYTSLSETTSTQIP